MLMAADYIYLVHRDLGSPETFGRMEGGYNNAVSQ